MASFSGFPYPHIGTGGRASKDHVRDECYTTLCVIGEQNPSFVVAGGTALNGDTNISGDLYVTGDATITGTLTTTITSTITDKIICLAIPTLPALPSDSFADGGGICLLGDTTKSIFWYDAEDAWRFNQNINLDQGISTEQPEDNTIAGSEYRIGGVSVLSATTLGTNVISSSLEEVGDLYKGRIDTSGTISAITSGNPTIITTTNPHGMQSGDSVFLSATNSTPTVNGWWTPVTYISDNQFSIATLTTVNGTSGNFEGGGFSISIGGANIESGGHTIQNGESSQWQNTSGVTGVTIEGGNGSVSTLSSVLSENMTNDKTYTGALAGVLTNSSFSTTWQDNTSGTTVRSLLSESTFNGTGTTYTNPFVDTIQQISTSSSTSVTNNTAVVNAISSENNSLADQDGVNWGFVSEADNADRANIGGLGMSGAISTAETSIGIWGAVNADRNALGAYAESTWISGTPINAGIYGYNPNTGVNNYAIAADGNVLLDGDVTITGTLTFPSSGVTSDLIPDTDNAYDLGSALATFKDIYYSGVLYGGSAEFGGNVIPDTDASFDLGSPTNRWNDFYLSGTLNSDGDIQADNLTPNADCTYDLGTAVLRYRDIYYCGTLTGGEIRPDTANTYDIGSAVLPYQDVYYNGALTGGSATFGGDVVPDTDATHDLGAPGSTWDNIYISGSIIGGSLSPSTLTLGIEQISAVGAGYTVDPNIGITEFYVTVSSTASLASASSAGQLKFINIVSLTAPATLTLSAVIINGTTLTFDAAGQSALLVSVTGGSWILVPGGAILS